MSLILTPLFHWSPKENRESILKHGLMIMSQIRGEEAQGLPWICLATTPSSAWGLILEPYGETEVWDLWQVNLKKKDHIYIKGDWAPYIREVRVMHGLPSDRVWWVGERMLYAHESIGE